MGVGERHGSLSGLPEVCRGMREFGTKGAPARSGEATAWVKLADDQASLISHDMIQVVPTEQHEKSLSSITAKID